MDRLQAVARRAGAATSAGALALGLGLGLGLAAGCGDGASGGAGDGPGGSASTNASTPPRVDSITAAPSTTPDKVLERFCDARPPADGSGAKPFALPDLSTAMPAPATAGGAGAAAGAATGGGWRWLNIWATWCKPCVEEIPMIGRWRERLGGEGVHFDLQLLSIDESAAAVDAWRKDHPETPPTLLIRDPAGLGKFVETLGLDAGAPIPIHVFVSPAGKVRCVRTGGLRETDYATVKTLLRGAA
jgi:thiol-disulfide isomerase/thioredoxin